MAFLILLIPLPAQVISLLMILLITFGEIVAMPFMNTYWSMRSNDNNRGQYAALITIAWSIGQTIGPFACSKLAEMSSFNVMFISIGCLLTFTAIGFNWLRLRN